MKTINVQFRYSVLHALASFQEAVKVMRWKEDLLDPPLFSVHAVIRTKLWLREACTVCDIFYLVSFLPFAHPSTEIG